MYGLIISLGIVNDCLMEVELVDKYKVLCHVFDTKYQIPDTYTYGKPKKSILYQRIITKPYEVEKEIPSSFCWGKPKIVKEMIIPDYIIGIEYFVKTNKDICFIFSEEYTEDALYLINKYIPNIKYIIRQKLQ